MSKLTYDKVENKYSVRLGPIKLGELSTLEDEFYYWFPGPTMGIGGGCLSSWVIKDISNKLEELNRTIKNI